MKTAFKVGDLVRFKPFGGRCDPNTWGVIIAIEAYIAPTIYTVYWGDDQMILNHTRDDIEVLEPVKNTNKITKLKLPKKS